MSNIITMYKGDTYTATIFINAGTHEWPARYILEGNDQVVVTIFNGNQYSSDTILTKTLTVANLNGFKDPVLNISPEDTAAIKAGNYYIKMKLKTGSDVLTILPPRKFIIL